MGKSQKNVQLLQKFVGAAFVMGLVGVFTAASVHAAAFSNKTVKGNYGCLGHEQQVNNGVGAGFSELMQLTFDGGGGVTGSMNLTLVGEQCNLPLSGTYSVNGNGTGQVHLTWGKGGADPDGDTDCVTTFNGVVQHMGLVIEGNGKEFDFEALDDFLSGTGITGTDQADLTDPFVGSCKSQNK